MEPFATAARNRWAVRHERPAPMLLTIAVILVILWALGLFAFHVTGALIHVLLVVAIVVGLVHLFRGRRV